jgi:hypothetical protein
MTNKVIRLGIEDVTGDAVDEMRFVEITRNINRFPGNVV